MIAILLVVLAASTEQSRGYGPPTANPALSVAGLLVLLVAVASLVRGLIFRRTAEYAVTDRRVIGKYGAVRQQSVDLLMTAISGASTSKSVLGRMFGYGNVWVNASGASRELKDVADPHAFQTAVYERLERSRLLKGPAAYTLGVRVVDESQRLSAAPLQPGTAAAAAFCSRCGSQLPTGSRFCPRCGSSI